MLEELREKDRVVLECIGEGRDDTQKITEATTLETHEARYSLEKLQGLGLIDVEKPDGMVERVVDGQKRVFRHPSRAELTDRGQGCVASAGEAPGDYRDLSRKELVERMHRLEARIEELEEQFEIFREQVQRKIE